MNFIEIWGTSGCLPLLFICEKYSYARLSQNTSRALVELMFLDTKTLLWGQEYKQQFFFRCSKLFKYAHIFKWLYLRIQCLFPVNFFMASLWLLTVIMSKILHVWIMIFVYVIQFYQLVYLRWEPRQLSNLCLNLLNMIRT